MFHLSTHLPNLDVPHSASMVTEIDCNISASAYYIDWFIVDDNGDVVSLGAPYIELEKHIYAEPITIPKPSNPLEQLEITPNDWDNFDINPIPVSAKQIDPTAMVTDKLRITVVDLPVNHTIIFNINHK